MTKTNFGVVNKVFGGLLIWLALAMVLSVAVDLFVSSLSGARVFVDWWWPMMAAIIFCFIGIVFMVLGEAIENGEI